MIDQDVRMEALSILLGAPVIQRVQLPDKTTENSLSVHDFVTAVIENGKKETSNNLLETRDSLRGSNLSPHVKEFFIDEQEFFDPVYDFDFTFLSETTKCVRGGEPYERPCGWYRMALNVRDKYPDGNTWLGTVGWRNESTPGEWPVSYHGTSIEGAKSIVRSHYKAGIGAAYGRGIYSTPKIQDANCYSKTFKSKKTGKSYKVVMQNRINTKERKMCEDSDYWLVPVPEGTSAEDERKIVERSIRPYGILIKEVKADPVTSKPTHVMSTTASTTIPTSATITLPATKRVTSTMTTSHATSSQAPATTTAPVIPKSTTALNSTPAMAAISTPAMPTTPNNGSGSAIILPDITGRLTRLISGLSIALAIAIAWITQIIQRC